MMSILGPGGPAPLDTMPLAGRVRLLVLAALELNKRAFGARNSCVAREGELGTLLGRLQALYAETLTTDLRAMMTGKEYVVVRRDEKEHAP